eukprot:9395676-Alexandrium_andersonii.AAC.1
MGAKWGPACLRWYAACSLDAARMFCPLVCDEVARLTRPERALDLRAGVGVSAVKAKVMDIASRIAGAEEDDIE